MTTPSLVGKVAIVTGGGRGIGWGISLALAGEGADVMVAARTRDEIQAVAQEIRAMGQRGAAFPVDVSDAVGVEAMVAATLERFDRVDILVNSAGISHQAPITEISDEDWDRVMAVNVTGTFLCSQVVGRRMLKQGTGGSIINISSYGGKVGLAFNALYCASKFAVIGLTESMGRELASHGIRVNAICPGRIETRMMADTVVDYAQNNGMPPEEMRRRLVGEIPRGRMGTPDEIAEVAVFLASDESSYITAQAINVNGGLDTT